MMASQSKETTLNNENNNQSTVNQTLGARLKTVNADQQLTINRLKQANKLQESTRFPM
jgi:hypothetical protein